MRLQLPFLVLALVASQFAFAHGNEKHTPSAMKPGRDSSAAQLTVDPAAAEAIAVVERFSAALGSGDLPAATAELDPAVLILESGGAEHSRDEYLGGHAKSDAEFLKNAQVTLKRRTAQAAGDLAWVGSESEIHAMKGADMLMISSSETMVLRKTAKGWKIVHIHWSSRKAAPTAAHSS
ncbi:nuclear transport factor 2 family protein [Tahibacter amnicola]|uniref:Nuclear transport factor 2 family protein n=1 Tax=Tahibacter amnicola TaxID=2976241 RepID=A0ABY6B7G7_9GAMM|nr:nuclear transport factor 2 family protein [Tahibacter amnicola]UXI66048.1 nuclear transport factor 2 family protein [Tahibacter amnicola]